MDDKFQLILNGTPTQRKQAVKDLINSVKFEILLNEVCDLLDDADEVQLQKLLKFLTKICQNSPRENIDLDIQLGEKFITKVKIYTEMEEGRVLIRSFLIRVGLKNYISSLRMYFTTSSENDRMEIAVCIALAAQVVGVSLIYPLTRLMLNSSHVPEQLLGLAVIPQLAILMPRSSILPVLGRLVLVCQPFLSDAQFSGAVNSALVTLADSTPNDNFHMFEPVLDDLWRLARSKREKLGYLRTLAAIANTSNRIATTRVSALDTDSAPAPSSTAIEMGESIFAILTKEIDSIPPNGHRILMNVLRRIAPFIVDFDVQVEFLNLVFTKFWSLEFKHSVTVLSQLEIAPSKLIARMIELQVFNQPEMSLMLLGKIKISDLALEKRYVQLLMENMVSCCLNLNTTPYIHAAFSSVGHSVSPNVLNEYIPILIQHLRRPEIEMRVNCLKAIAALSPALQNDALKKTIFNQMMEEMGEESPDILAEVLNCIQQLLDYSEADTLLPRLTPILRNRNENVQEQCIILVKKLAQTNGDSVSAREWMQCCFEMLELQKSQRQSVRHEATSAFAAIAEVVGPADVANTLVKHLKSPDRQFRVTTAAAIASVAKSTGAFAILPILLTEYQTEDIVIQHGVLKSISFISQFLEPADLRPFITSLVTLMDHALLNSNQVSRQTAASIVDSMAKASVGHSFEPIFIHLLNELMPSIFETSPHVIDRVVDAITSIGNVIGAPAFVNYLFAGLYHPAQKVRKIYWRLWNEMYKQHKDVLCVSYPVDVPDAFGDGDIRDTWI